MATPSFSAYLFAQTGLVIGSDTVSQNQFSVNYTAWLTSILTNDAADWLHDQLGDIGSFSVKINQNDPTGAPYIQYLDANQVSQTFSLSDLFGGSPEPVVLKTGKVTQTRYFFDEFSVPSVEDVNDAPTDIHLTVDAGFAALATGQTAGGPNDAANNEVRSIGAVLVGILTAADADVGDTHSFSIESGNTGGQFSIMNGNELWLVGDNVLSSGENFSLLLKVTDSGGLEYFETFSVVTGNNSANQIVGIDHGGSGTTALDPVVGDDIIFGFGQNDTLNKNSDSTVQGTSGDDILFGGQGTDTLLGDAGNDQLFGGVNDDVLIGGAGDDVLRGGHGADTFVFSLASNAGQDTILDFARGADKLNFSDVIDVGSAGLNIADVDAAISGFANGGAGGDVTVNFNNGASLTLIGMGSASTIDSIGDLVDSTAQIVVS